MEITEFDLEKFNRLVNKNKWLYRCTGEILFEHQNEITPKTILTLPENKILEWWEYDLPFRDKDADELISQNAIEIIEWSLNNDIKMGKYNKRSFCIMILTEMAKGAYNLFLAIKASCGIRAENNLTNI